MSRLLTSAAAAALMSATAYAADLPLPEEPIPEAIAAPSWHFWADASVLIMQREFTNDVSVASSAAGGGPGAGDVFDSDDFDPEDWELGAEGALGITNGRWGVEARGFWLDTFEEDATVNGPIAGLTIDTNPLTNYGLGAGDTLTGSFTSDIHGAEGSVSFEAMPNATIYAGPRWIQLEEEFDLLGDFGGATELDRWDVRNQLIGGQVGFRTDWIALMSGSPGAFSLNSDVSVGVFDNEAESDFEVFDSGASRFGTISDDDSLLAFAVDASLTAGYHFTPNFEIFAGYNVLFIDGVATAVEQVGGTTSFNAVPTIDVVDGSVLFHGGRAGVKVRF